MYNYRLIVKSVSYVVCVEGDFSRIQSHNYNLCILVIYTIEHLTDLQSHIAIH